MAAPRDNRSYSVDAKRVATEFGKLPTKARRILRLCDGMRGDERICAASPLPRDATLQILGRLEKLGLIVAGPPPTPAKIRERVTTPTSVQRWVAGVAGEASSDPMEATQRVPVEVARQLAQPTLAAAAVAPAPASLAAPAAPHFSAEEEAFFARPLEDEPTWTAEDEAALR